MFFKTRERCLVFETEYKKICILPEEWLHKHVKFVLFLGDFFGMGKRTTFDTLVVINICQKWSAFYFLQ